MNISFDDDDLIFSNTPGIVLAVNGSLSAVSSLLIMAIISRSSPEARFSSYHIIMFFMSFWDFISSVSMSLGTLPMPTDVYEIYPFAGKALGNVGTCDAQGFLIFMAALFVLNSNILLNIYYVCTLRYGMEERVFKTFILPVLMVIFSTVSFLLPAGTLRMKFFNPSPLTYYCTYNAYPYGCALNQGGSGGGGYENEIKGNECIRGQIFQSTLKSVRLLAFILIGGAFLVLVISLILVIITVFEAELAVRRSRRTQRARRAGESARSRASIRETEFKRTRDVLIQALMYIFAFVLTYVWSIIIFARLETYSAQRPGYALAFLNVFFPPLQGFFNAMIFIYQKVHTLRQGSPGMNFTCALRHVIMLPSSIPELLVSRIEIVEEDVMLRRQGDFRNIPNIPIRRRGQLRTSMIEHGEGNFSDGIVHSRQGQPAQVQPAARSMTNSEMGVASVDVPLSSSKKNINMSSISVDEAVQEQAQGGNIHSEERIQLTSSNASSHLPKFPVLSSAPSSPPSEGYSSIYGMDEELN